MITSALHDELVERVRSGLERRGFHIFDREELALIWLNLHSASARMAALQMLAKECAAVVDPDSGFDAVRFNAAGEFAEAPEGALARRG